MIEVGISNINRTKDGCTISVRVDKQTTDDNWQFLKALHGEDICIGAASEASQQSIEEPKSARESISDIITMLMGVQNGLALLEVATTEAVSEPNGALPLEDTVSEGTEAENGICIHDGDTCGYFDEEKDRCPERCGGYHE
jgi:hypothetical protein